MKNFYSVAKFFILLSVISIFFGIFSYQITYACSVCTQAPANLETYFTTMDKLLGVLDTPPFVPQGTGFAADKEEIMFATKATLLGVSSATFLSTVLFMHATLVDLGGELSLLEGTEMRRRDWEKILDYDRKIMQKGLSIGQKGYVGKTVSEAQLKKIDEILKNLGYLELTKDSSGYTNLVKGMTYENVLTLYWNLNYIYKKLHQKKWYHKELEDVGSEFRLVDSLSGDETKTLFERESLKIFMRQIEELVDAVFFEQQQELRGDKATYLTFLDNYTRFGIYIWKIQQDYACGIGVKDQCNTNRKQLVQDSWERTRENTIQGRGSGGSVGKIFSDALARLRGALWSKNPDDIKKARQREEVLMQSIYGNNVPASRQWRRYSDEAMPDKPGASVVETNVDIDNAEGLQETIHDIEQTAATTKSVVKRLQDIAKDENLNQINKYVNSASLVANYVASPLGSLVNISNLPHDPSQENAGKYRSDDEKKQALAAYNEQPPKTKGNAQEIELQGFYASTKRTNQAQTISQVFTDTFALQQQREQTSMFDDVRSVTKLMPLLSVGVYRNIELWGDKNDANASETSSIYNSAGKICEMQCSNIQGKCRYFTD